MTDMRQQKQLARKSAALRRDQAEHRDVASEKIRQTILNTSQVQAATSVCCYVSFRSEVATHALINDLLAHGKQVCIPWCDGDDLRLCEIESLDELAPGTFGVLEPPETLRQQAGRQQQLSNCTVALIPGLAFTSQGHRLGYGKGFYDRLLNTSLGTLRIALSFDCQIVPTVPTTEHDVEMNMVVTETTTHLPKI